MLKVTIETDDPNSEAFQKILEILGQADEVQLEDPLFPDHLVSIHWYMENWHADIPEVKSLIDTGLTPKTIRDIIRSKPLRELPNALQSSLVRERVSQQLENIEMERAAKSRRLSTARA